jgi:CDP-diacylglycerol--serine O-phosphatidyltransferase
MKDPMPDGSRDLRIEDPTNLWIIHPAGRLLLPWFIARRISANSVSLIGLMLGALAALSYSSRDRWQFAFAGLLLSVAWLIADGLDGMIARATNTASPLGRALDGLCDHGVFVLIYVVLALSIGTLEGWVLTCLAGAAHAVQSNLYESERARYHRRCKLSRLVSPASSSNPLVRLYDRVAGTLDGFASPFDRALKRQDNPARLAEAYGVKAAAPMRLMILLTANVRVFAIFLACLARSPRLFLWFELVPLSVILVTGIVWHRAIEAQLIRTLGAAPVFASTHTHSKDVTN